MLSIDDRFRSLVVRESREVGWVGGECGRRGGFGVKIK